MNAARQKFAVGDIAMAAIPHQGLQRVYIERVGRKWVTTRGLSPDGSVQSEWSRRTFDLETGSERVSYGSPGTLYTPEGWERQDLTEALASRYNLGPRSFGTSALDTATPDQLRRIIAILEEEQ